MKKYKVKRSASPPKNPPTTKGTREMGRPHSKASRATEGKGGNTSSTMVGEMVGEGERVGYGVREGVEDKVEVGEEEEQGVEVELGEGEEKIRGKGYGVFGSRGIRISSNAGEGVTGSSIR